MESKRGEEEEGGREERKRTSRLGNGAVGERV